MIIASALGNNMVKLFENRRAATRRDIDGPATKPQVQDEERVLVKNEY
jgi:hypothetical protein